MIFETTELQVWAQVSRQEERGGHSGGGMAAGHVSAGPAAAGWDGVETRPRLLH